LIIQKYGLNRLTTALIEMGLNNRTSLGHNCRQTRQAYITTDAMPEITLEQQA